MHYRIRISLITRGTVARDNAYELTPVYRVILLTGLANQLFTVTEDKNGRRSTV